MKVHHGKKEKNPVDYIHFYHKIDAQHGIKATEDDVARCRKEMREAMDKGNDERVKELAIAISDMKRSKRGEDALPPIAAPVSSTKYSATLPITFIERSIRIFCKHRKLCAVPATLFANGAGKTMYQVQPAHFHRSRREILSGHSDITHRWDMKNGL